MAHSAARRFFHARFHGGRVGQRNAGRFPLEPVSHPCTSAAHHLAWAVHPICIRGYEVSAVDFFPSAERIEAYIFESKTNERLAQARAILSLSRISPASISAAANIIGAVMADIVFGCCSSLDDDDVTALRFLLGQARALLHDLRSDDAGIDEEAFRLICDASSAFAGRAINFVTSLCC